MLIDVARTGRLLAAGLLGAALLGLPAAFDGGRGLMARADDTTVRSSATATSSSSSSSSSSTKSSAKPGDCTSEATSEATTTVNGQTTTKRDHDKKTGGECAARASSEAKAGNDGGKVRTDATAN
jgi:hypothetical protein